jgi:hypothetical protein
MRRLPVPVLLVLSGAVLVGCGDDDPAAAPSSSPASSSSSASDSSSSPGSSSSSPASGTAAVCSSLDELQSSVAALTQVPVGEGGLDALRTAFSTVQEDAAQVIDDARGEHADRSDQLSADVSAVQTALGDAASNPGAATLQAVGGAISSLSADVTAFAGDVASTC